MVFSERGVVFVVPLPCRFVAVYDCGTVVLVNAPVPVNVTLKVAFSPVLALAVKLVI